MFLVSPEILVRSASKPFVVVSFALEELLEVRLAVKFAMEGSVGAEAQFGTTVLTAEAPVVKDVLVSDQSLHRVHSRLTG